MMQIRPSSRDSSNIHKTCEAKVEALNALVTSLRRENAALREAYSSNNMNGHSSGRSSLFFGCFGAGTSSGGHDSSDREELMQELESLKDELDTYRKKLDINTGLSVKIPQGSVKFVQPNRSKSLSKVSIGDLHDDGEGNTDLLNSILAQDGTKESIGPVVLQQIFTPLDCLPEEIRSIDSGMNALPAIKEAPMRLLKLRSFFEWPSLVVYGDVIPNDFVEIPYHEVSDEIWSQTAILSWRWHQSKPWTHADLLAKPGFSPMSQEQFIELRAMLKAVQESLSYVWIDWCCVGQYLTDSMIEVLRSKIFYARSLMMLVLPTFGSLPEQGVLCALLGLVKSTLISRNKLKSSVVAQAIDAIESKKRLASREYFARVWTLAERMARHGRNERLCNWLSLESWIGMLLDAVFRSVDDETVLAAYVKILGQRSEQLLSNLDPLLRAACSSGTIQSPLIQEHLADVCELGIKAWLPSDESSLAEAPTKDWLKVYLGKEATSGVYNAFSQDDRVWAVYTYFCWRPVTDRRKEALRKATELLVDLANDKDAEEEARREGMFIQLNLEANAEGWTPLHRACSKGRTETVRSLMTSLSADRSELMETDKSGFKPLHLACINGHVEVARVLIEAGAEIDTRDDVGYTGLMFAAGEGRGEHYESVIRLLIKAGADVNSRASDGYTPLIWSSAFGNEGSAKVLLDAGANLEAKENRGYTSLAIASENAYGNVVEVLIAAGADLEATDIYGNTPLILSCRNGYMNIVKMLLNAGAKTTARDIGHKSALDWAQQMHHSKIIQLLEAHSAS